MTILYTKVLLYTLVFLDVTVTTEHMERESFKNFENIFDFTVGLRNETDNILDYTTKIQALFCPEQAICTAEADRNRTDVLNTLPEIFEIGTENIRIDDVHKIIAACCMPCSCDTKTCKENGNCCLSKTVADAFQNNPDIDEQNAVGFFEILNDASEFKDENVTAVYSECIQATSISYRDKNAIEIAGNLDIPGYFMITQCFENNSSQEEVTKCQNPSEYAEEVMVPVISSATGRIYWNSHCAHCNNDGRDISPWTVSVKFDTDIAYFMNYSYPSVPAVPGTYNEIHEFISKTGTIVYRPPFPQEDKLCLRKNNLWTCKDPRTKRTGSWLEKACERIYSPLIIENAFGMSYAFLNIFCYICRQQYIRPNANRKCGSIEQHAKDVNNGIEVLLDYKAFDSIDNALGVTSRQDKCRCDEIYDLHLVSTIIYYDGFVLQTE